MFVAWLCILAAGQISIGEMSVASSARKRSCEDCSCDHDRRCGFWRRNRVQKVQSVFARQEQGTRYTAKEACVHAGRTKGYGSREQTECREIAKAATRTEESRNEVEAESGNHLGNSPQVVSTLSVFVPIQWTGGASGMRPGTPPIHFLLELP